jgi:TusA-related sulfurtransferase/peroxiredoxin family protein
VTAESKIHMQTAQDNPFIDLQPAQTLDCRGMVCPAPILELSKAARAYGKQTTVLEIIVDDAEFPNDLRAWCRASKNTLLNLMEDEGLFVAHVGLNIRGEEKGPASGPRTVATSQKAPALLTPSGELRAATTLPSPGGSSEHPLHTIDCRGMLCPAPILAVAKKAQQLGRQPALMEIFATDEQFPTDLKAWCRASKAQLVNVDRIDGEIRALVALGNVPEDVIKSAMPAPIEEVSMPLVNVKVAAAHVVPKPGDLALKPTVPDLPKAQVFSPPAPELLRKPELPVLAPPVAALATPAAVVAAPKAVATPPMPVALRSSPLPEPPKSAPNVGVLAAVAPANDVSPQAVPRENRCTVLVTKADTESLLAAVTYASTAASRGMDATIFFSFSGVSLLRADSLRSPAKGIAQGLLQRSNLRSLEEWLAQPMQQNVKLVVCTMSLGLMGIQKQEIAGLLNVQFADVGNFVEVSRRSAMTMVL